LLISHRTAQYRTTFGCELCNIAWVSPTIECTLEEIFEMNTRMFCPRCSASAEHEDPYLRLAPEILNIQDVGNEFAIIVQF
jgi:transcription elongation factor Elf1